MLAILKSIIQSVLIALGAIKLPAAVQKIIALLTQLYNLLFPSTPAPAPVHAAMPGHAVAPSAI